MYVARLETIILDEPDCPSADGTFAPAGREGFMAPEQYSGMLDARSDVFAAGAVLFHLVTGTDPAGNHLLVFDFAGNPSPRQLNPALTNGRVLRVSDQELEGARIVFADARYTLAYLVSAEVYVEKLLDRAEFRRHGDAYSNRPAILANLK